MVSATKFTGYEAHHLARPRLKASQRSFLIPILRTVFVFEAETLDLSLAIGSVPKAVSRILSFINGSKEKFVRSILIQWVAQTGQAIEMSVHRPSLSGRGVTKRYTGAKV